jgi:hypothetical protein
MSFRDVSDLNDPQRSGFERALRRRPCGYDRLEAVHTAAEGD